MTAILKPPSIQRSLLTQQAVAKGGSNVTPFAPPARSRHDKQQIVRTQRPGSLQTSAKTVSIPANVQRIPAWLAILVTAQRGSNFIICCLVASVLATYSWTVYSQHQWSSNYRRLKDLQRTEQELTATAEVWKSQIATEAENPSAGLILPNSDNSISLEAAPLRPPVVVPEPVPSISASDLPLGY